MQYKHRFCFSPLLSALLVALLSACSSADGLGECGDGAAEDYAVTFAASDGWKEVEGTRSGDASSLASGDASSLASDNTSSFAPGDAFGLFAYHNASATPDFMNNQRVTFDGTSWTYSPTKYWPRTDGDRLSFYATSPHSAIANGDVSVAAAADGHPTAVYDNTRADIDWTVAKREAVTYADGKDGVVLNFKHLTARVKFRFAIDGSVSYHPVVHVLKYNVPHYSGTVDFSLDKNNAFVCDQTSDGDAVQIVRYVNNVEGEIVNADGITVPEFTAYLFPCSFPCTDDTEEIGEFVISLNNIEHTCKPSEFITVAAGKSYTINFNIKQSDSGSTNYFITSYSLWEDGGDYEENLN